jgi:hypothetical protein
MSAKATLLENQTLVPNMTNTFPQFGASFISLTKLANNFLIAKHLI